LERPGYRPVFVHDGDRSRAGQIAAYLTNQGLPAEAYSDADPLLSRLSDVPPSLVLLHWSGTAPHSAMNILRQVRSISAVPCVLRARESNSDLHRIAGLDNGADDCIPAAFTEREVVARIRAIMRRTAQSSGELGEDRTEVEEAAPAPVLRRPVWRLSLDRRELYTPSGKPCELTSAEFDFLHVLTRKRGTPVSRSLLYQEVFRRPWYPEDRGIDNLAARLRRKLAAHCPNVDSIKSVRGVGYLFTGF